MKVNQNSPINFVLTGIKTYSVDFICNSNIVNKNSGEEDQFIV